MSDQNFDGSKSADSDSPLQLNDKEARVLGALMEKERTTPEAYPLTQNALTSACNQKSSREPVMAMSPGEVGHTLRALESRDLITVETGARSERFCQRLSQVLALNEKRQALICLLLLRGPQTLVELLNRSARLTHFESVEDVRLSLLKLIERPTPLVTQLERQSGQREERYAQLLSGAPISTAVAHTLDTADAMTPPKGEMAELKARIEQLESTVTEIKRQLGIEDVTEMGQLRTGEDKP